VSLKRTNTLFTIFNPGSAVMNRVVFFLMSATMLIAAEQEECFDIRKYVAPEFQYHLLELSPDLSVTGTKTHTKEGAPSSSINSILMGEPTKESKTKPNIGIEARHHFYRWKRGTEWDITGNVTVSESGYMNNENTTKRDP
jgi:hypothetical protein